MTDKLQSVEDRFEKVNELLCLSETVADNELYTKLMRELKQLTPVVEKFREFKKIQADFEEAKQIIADYKPQFASIAEYFECVNQLILDKDAVVYDENGNATIDYQN